MSTGDRTGNRSALYELVAPERPTAVVDVGASAVGRSSYQPLIELGIATLVGFEPLPELFAPLASRRRPHETYLPYALGDGASHTLYVCAHAPMSSFLKPDPRQLHQFLPMAQWGRILAEREMPTRRLDDIAEIAAIDFLKLDVQGFELTVLQHGRAKLAEAVAVQAEVPFVTTYEKQPTLGDIDQELRAQGFMPHMFIDLMTRMLAPMLPPEGGWRGINQLHEGDLVYVRDVARAERLGDEQLKHTALLAHHCFRSYDLAYRCLHLLVERRSLPASAPQDYLAMLRRASR
jgi:FkbM family methyltransferase